MLAMSPRRCGLLAVLIAAALYYHVFGLIADIALILNLVLLIAVLSIFQATLTMPGIAGIVLTLGMAIDANVLICERIREELRNGSTPLASIRAGYEKAWATILDANVTHLIAALALTTMGSGPIKGFGVTLLIGILTSMFTSVTVTHALVNLVYSGRKLKGLAVGGGYARGAHRGMSAAGSAGSAAVYAPEGLSALQWDASTEILLFKVDRHAVEDALSDALGRQLTSQPDFAPLMPTNAAPARNWINMLVLFAEQFLHPDGLLNQPLVGMPFIDTLVRGFLLAAEHSHRDALMGRERSLTPRAIRRAVDVIEAEAQLPLTLSSIAARSQMSVRSLQQGFKRHLGMSPMSYLREVRLRRAHQTLLESDPSTVTVASVAYDWGFTNLGRFAAAHAARYREPPAKTLRRSA